MLKYIFKSATGSFSRTIGRILAYILIGFLIMLISSKFNLMQANAEDNILLPPSGPFVQSPYARLYYISNDRLTHNPGTSIDEVYNKTTSTPVWSYFKSDTIPSTFPNSIPKGVAFNINDTFIEGYIYSLTLYVGAGYNSYVYLSSTYGSQIYLGGTLGGAAGNFETNNINANVLYSAATVGNVRIYEGYAQQLFSSGVLTFVFVANTTAPCVFIPFDLTSSSFGYYGYHLEVLGKYEDTSNADLSAKIDNVQKSVEETNEKINEVNNTMKDDKVDGAQGSANSFFNDFEDKDYGLSGVITMPLTFINKITSGTCTPLSFPAPFVNQNITLPCMYDIYQTYFGDFLTIYQTITFGVVSYWVCINIFHMVKNFKNPDNDEIEVLDL